MTIFQAVYYRQGFPRKQTEKLKSLFLWAHIVKSSCALKPGDERVSVITLPECIDFYMARATYYFQGAMLYSLELTFD